MQRSEAAIRTTHAGRLPPVAPADTDVTRQVAEVIRKQVQIGISCVGDGEFWNGRNFAVLRAAIRRASRRGRLRPASADRAGRRPANATRCRSSMPTWIASARCSASPARSRGFLRRPRWSSPARSRAAPPTPSGARSMCSRRRSRPPAAPRRLSSACSRRVGSIITFSTSTMRPTRNSCSRSPTRMREEYRAVVDAGFILQIDDPGFMTSWDMIKPEPNVAEYRRYLKIRIDALNHALAGIPRGSRAPPFLLGFLARRAHPRPAAEGGHRSRRLRCARRPTVSRPAMSVTSTNGRSGRTSSCPPARSSCRAWSATRPTSSSIPS